MNRYFFACIIFLLSLQAVKIVGQDTSRCPSGYRLMQVQDYLAAAEAFSGCLHVDTTDYYMINSLSFCYLQAGDYANAKYYYHRLENADTFRTEALMRLASIYEASQDLPKAIKYNLALQKQFPGNPAYLRKLGTLYLQGRENSQAIQSYKAALSLNPRDVIAIQGLTEIMISMDSLDQADSLLAKGIQVDSMHIGLNLIRSRVHYRKREYRQTADLLYSLSFRTELNNYYNKMLGYAFMQIDSLDKAIFHLQKSLLHESDPEYALFYLALAYERKKELERSDWYYAEAVKAGISQNIGQYFRGRARIAMQLNKNRDAIDYYTKSLQYEEDPFVYFYMANAADLHYTDKTKALEYYRKYLNSGHKDQELVRIAKSRIAAIRELRFMKPKQD